MKHTLFIATLIYFLLLNTIQLWDIYLGFYSAFVVFPVLIIYSIILLVSLIFQMVLLIKQKNRTKLRVIHVIFLILALTTAYYFPTGLIPYDIFTEDDVLVAKYDGTVCGSTIKLKKDNTFIEREICFSTRENRGWYEIKGDTMYFNITNDTESDGFYKFGVIQKIHKTNKLVLFESQADTIGLYYSISNNELKSLE